jgi:hypothetical protein
MAMGFRNYMRKSRDGGHQAGGGWNFGRIWLSVIPEAIDLPMFSTTPDTVEQRLKPSSACTWPNWAIRDTLVCNYVVAMLILRVILSTYAVLNITQSRQWWKTLALPLKSRSYVIYGGSYNYIRFGGRHLEFRQSAHGTRCQTLFRSVGGPSKQVNIRWNRISMSCTAAVPTTSGLRAAILNFDHVPTVLGV